MKAITCMSVFASCVLPTIAVAQESAPRPNVLFIISDDLNTYLGHLGSHPQAQTPHLDRLAASGVSFARAYTSNPICAPSRASLFSGILPQVSRSYTFEPWYLNAVLADSRLMQEQFAANGYRVGGTGKLLHHEKKELWPEFGHEGNPGPYPWDGQRAVGHPSVPLAFREIGLLNGSFGSLADVPFCGVEGAGWTYDRARYDPFNYESDEVRSPMPDELNAQWAGAFLEQHARRRAAGDRQPFFLAVGLTRPHTPLYAPQKYFDLYPLESLALPELRPGSKAGRHYFNLMPDNSGGPWSYRKLREAYGDSDEGLRRFLQAYLACVSFMDAQVGALLDALEAQGFAENTIVVMTSDHGWMMGEKSYIGKDAPWELSTRVPLLVRVPGLTPAGGTVEAPVSLVDIYPTLLDLCGLPADTRKGPRGASLCGSSLRPLLMDPTTVDWGGPAEALTHITAVAPLHDPDPARDPSDPLFHHYTLRSRDFRYIRYNDGVEELYDHRVDPGEWNDVAADPAYAESLANLRAHLAQRVPPAPACPEPPTDRQWMGFPINGNGYVDTGKGFLGRLWVGLDGRGVTGWRYAAAIGRWIFMPDNYYGAAGAWFFIGERGALDLVPQGEGFYYSQKLGAKLQQPAPGGTTGEGWVFIQRL